MEIQYRILFGNYIADFILRKLSLEEQEEMILKFADVAASYLKEKLNEEDIEELKEITTNNYSEVDGLSYLLEVVIEKKEEELAELKDMLQEVKDYDG